MTITNRLPAGLLSGLGLLLVSLCIAPAQAQPSDQVTGLQPKVRQLRTFSEPYGAAVQSIGALKLPLPVLAVDGDFLKVKLDGKDVWIDGGDVIIEKPVAYDCVAATKGKPAKVAVTQAASAGCK